MNQSGNKTQVISEDSAVVQNQDFSENIDVHEVNYYKHPLDKPLIDRSKLSHSSSKSNDSLDSGIDTRPKSSDSMDSLDCPDADYNGDGLSPSDEAIPPLPPNQYEDYLRECQDIRQSIIVRSGDEEKQPVSRTDSGEDQDEEPETEWFRMAGLSDLVMEPTSPMRTSVDGTAPSRATGENLSSMTVLSTLTRPQREAVLRRISSFNRAQKTKRRSKPSIASIFPSVELSPKSSPPNDQHNTETTKTTLDKPADLAVKSVNLPRTEDGATVYQGRRYSELHRPRAPTSPPSSDFDMSDNSHSKSDYLSKHKKNVDSIVASSMSGVSAVTAVMTDKHDLTKPSIIPTTTQSSSNFTQLSVPISPSSSSSVSLPDLTSRYIGFDLNKTSDKTQAQSYSQSLVDKDKCSGVVDIPNKKIEVAASKEETVSDENDEIKLSETQQVQSEDISTNKLKPATSIHKLPLQKSNSSSPESKSRYLQVPTLQLPLSTSPFRLNSSVPHSPNNEEGKQSAFQKLSSSFSNLQYSPKRNGSYKFSLIKIDKPLIKRARSLKVRKKPSPDVSSKFASPSIETLSISTKTLDGSWKDSKENLPTTPSDQGGKPGKSLSYSEAAKQENLPNYSLVRDRLGITKISDLHSVDMRKVQSLAIIELTALFDLRNIDLKRRKLGKIKPKESGVFGIPLSVLIEYDRKRTSNNDLRVPLVLSEIISFLEKNALENEGILRKSGAAARIKLLKQDIEVRFGINSPDPLSDSETWNNAHPNDVAALLKQFLRELPDPLLTTQFIDAFQSCGLITDRKEQLQALNLLIILLNEVHRDSLKLLLKFLASVVANEEHNKMSLNNVAMITAPNLFISGRKNKPKEAAAGQDLKHAAGTSNIVRMLIKYHKLLWTVPAFMLSQVRLMNSTQITSKKHHSTSKEKYRKFFQGGKSKDLNKKLSLQAAPQAFDYDTPKGLIRVQGPNVKLTSIAVQLDDKLTAGDVLNKYHRQCERMQRSTSGVKLEMDTSAYALYEVGGNIHERCLDPETNMNALIRENTEATWLIRERLDF